MLFTYRTREPTQHIYKTCIEYDLSRLFDWFGANSLTLNISKTNMLLFDYRKNINSELEINIGGKSLKSVKCTKFLGVMLDCKLTWKEHSNQLNTKLNRNYVLLCKSKNLLNVHEMKMPYYAQIYSHLSYCVVLWGSMLSTEYKCKLRSLQNKCVKLIDLTRSTDHTYKKHNILKFEH